MKKSLVSLLLILLTNCLFAQMAANNTCSTYQDLGTITNTAISHTSSLYQANQTNIGTCANRYDVWYRFTMPAWSRAAVIRVSLGSPTSLATSNTYIEVFSTLNCGANTGTSTGCNTIQSSRAFSLTPGSTYYFRINTTVNPSTNVNNWNFTVNIWAVPNDCANATTMQPGVSNYTGSVVNATASTGTPAIPAACSGTPDDDVCYK